MEVCQTWRMERTTVLKKGIRCPILFLHLHVQVGPNHSKSCSAPCMSCLKIWREAFMPPLINLGRCFGLESHSDNVMPSPKMQAEHGHISWLLLQWSSMYLRPNLATQTNLRFQGAVLHFYDKHHVIVLLKTCGLHNLKSLTWLRSFYLANLHNNPAHTCLSIFGSGFSPPMCWVFAWPHGSEQQVNKFLSVHCQKQEYDMHTLYTYCRIDMCAQWDSRISSHNQPLPLVVLSFRGLETWRMAHWLLLLRSDMISMVCVFNVSWYFVYDKWHNV